MNQLGRVSGIRVTRFRFLKAIAVFLQSFDRLAFRVEVEVPLEYHHSLRYHHDDYTSAQYQQRLSISDRSVHSLQLVDCRLVVQRGNPRQVKINLDPSNTFSTEWQDHLLRARLLY